MAKSYYWTNEKIATKLIQLGLRTSAQARVLARVELAIAEAELAREMAEVAREIEACHG